MTAATLAAAVVACVLCATAAGAAPNDYRVVLYERIGPYKDYLKGRYPAAVRAFGEPASSGFAYQSNYCTVRWRKLGLELDFITLGVETCVRKRLTGWYGARLYSRRWLVGRGIRVGDTVAAMRRLYPKATFVDKPPWEPTWTLATVDGDELGKLRTLTARTWNGRITSIELGYPGVF